MTVGLACFATAIFFHGIIGQSAGVGECPLSFTGVQSIVELPCGRVVFAGDDGGLYEVLEGRPVYTGKAMHGTFLDFDGKVLRSLGRHAGVWEIDLTTFDSKCLIHPGRVRWDLAGVRPEMSGQPVDGRGKYVTWDPLRDKLIAYDRQGNESGVLFDLPPRRGNCRIEGLGFLPGSGDLLMVTYWPDLQICRFHTDGSLLTGNGWPVRRGFGFLRQSGGRIFHCGTGSLLPLADNMTYQKGIVVGSESVLTGYARQGEWEYIGTSQGLYVKEPGEVGFNRRLGGIAPLSALVLNDGYIFMSMGEKIRWMRLDGDEFEPFCSSDSLSMRINNGKNWKDRIVGLDADGPGWLKVATGDAGRWRFRPNPPPEYVNQRKFWMCESMDRCESVSSRRPSKKLLHLIETSKTPGGMKVGKVATDGKWLIAEDLKNHRLVRYRIATQEERMAEGTAHGQECLLMSEL